MLYYNDEYVDDFLKSVSFKKDVVFTQVIVKEKRFARKFKEKFHGRNFMVEISFIL